MSLTRLGLRLALPVATAAQAGKPTNYKGLEVTPLGIERAKNVALIDCPPGHQHRPRQRARRRRVRRRHARIQGHARLQGNDRQEAGAHRRIRQDLQHLGVDHRSGLECRNTSARSRSASPLGTKVASVAIDTATINVAALDK